MPASAVDLFCRVIDNFGDVGVCWRLASGLAMRGQAVRLWIDDASALAWMAPGLVVGDAAGVQVLPWGDPPVALVPAPLVIEAFGCQPPEAFVARMAAMPQAPVWINLEYLSAEAYAERSHGLRSPQFSGAGAGLDKWFFYPGFTPATGGLLHGLDGLDRSSARAWVARQGWGAAAGERAVLLFGYANAALPRLLAALAPQPTLLWLPQGPLQAALAGVALPAGQRAIALPWLAQTDFDRLIAAADLKLVRGEDSFVRAQLLGDGPVLWQIYPQDDGAHAPKLAAWLDRYLAGAPANVAAAVRQAHTALNALEGSPSRASGATHARIARKVPLTLPDAAAWAAVHRAWQHKLLAQDDLLTQLLCFAEAKRAANRAAQ